MKGKKFRLTIFKVFVPLNREGAKGWIFNIVCPGNAMSVSHERLLLLKIAKVNRNLSFDEVCGEKHVLIAYRNQYMREHVEVPPSEAICGLFQYCQ